MMSLPLSAEYERKKQRLQHELCMDYRHYVGQVTVTYLFTCLLMIVLHAAVWCQFFYGIGARLVLQR